jgi:hypothetical protein
MVRQNAVEKPMKSDPSKKPTELRDIAEQFKELQELRGQVRQAEQAATSDEQRSQGVTKH